LNSMKIYISGKIGETVPSKETIAKFMKAEDMLLAKGMEVFNPTTSGLGQHAESLAQKNGTTFWEEIVLLDIEELKKCDAIYMLEDFRRSDGAMSEYHYAKGAGKSMIFAYYHHAAEWLFAQYDKLCDQGREPLEPDWGEEPFETKQRYVRENINKIWLPLNGKREL